MTGPEANQQYDLWVDRCRQQLERGAAGGALALWMQSEGVSADTAAAILEAARGGPEEESIQPVHADSTPATVPETGPAQPQTAPPFGADTGAPKQDGASAQHVTAAAPAQRAHAPDSAATVFAKAFRKPGEMARGDTTHAQPAPSQPDTAPTVEPTPAASTPTAAASQPTAQTVSAQEPPTALRNIGVHPEFPTPPDPATPDAVSVTQPAQHTAAPPEQSPDPPTPPSVGLSSPFGTPRPPIVFPPAPAPTEDIPHEDDALAESPPQETPAATEPGDDARRDFDAPPDNDSDMVLRNESDSPVAEPDPKSGLDADQRPDNGAPADAAPEDRTRDLEISMPDEPDAPADIVEPPSRKDGDEFVEEESADFRAGGLDAAEHPLPMEPAAQAPAPAPDLSLDEPPPDDESPDMSAPEEPCQFEGSPEDTVSPTGGDLRQSPRQATAESHADFMPQEEEACPEPSDSPTDEPVAEPADEPVAEPADEFVGETADESDVTPGEEHNGTAQEATGHRTFGRRHSSSAASVGTAKNDGGEPVEAMRDADGEEAALQRSGSTAIFEGELARAVREAEQAAAHKSDPLPGHPEPKTEERLAALAKAQGISSRDDPAGPDAVDPDNPIAKSGGKLEIVSRDAYPQEAEQKSILARFWPIILVLAFALIALPIAAAFLAFAGT